MKARFVSVGSVDCQYEENYFAKSEHSHADQHRYCEYRCFIHSCTHIITKKSNRVWLCYSPTTVYCFKYKLESTDGSAFSRGFNDWKNVKRGIDFLKKSLAHLSTSIAFKHRSQSSKSEVFK